MSYYLNDFGLLCALGSGKQAVRQTLCQPADKGLILSDKFSPGQPRYLGQVQTALPEIPANLEIYACRNNQLLMAAAWQIMPTIEAMKSRFGRQRIGMVLGTSTSGIRNTELALADQAIHQQLSASYHYKQQQLGAGADFLAAYLEVGGPCYSVSAACASSGKAFASAQRLLDSGICDAVIVGGADSLCALTVNGFASLESLSAGLAQPFGLQRDGINIGEAASLFVLSREPAALRLGGVGASNDGYHFSAPDPSGKAVISAMQKALSQAGLSSTQVNYINLHGTGTLLNDAMESRAVAEVFGLNTPVSSSKTLTGHTLGAAAALELALCCLLMTENEQGLLIAHPSNPIDPDLPQLNWVKAGQGLGKPVQVCQSNSFAFGGSNVSIVVTQA